MKKLRKKLPEKLTRIILGIAMAIAGLFILIYPDSSLITICTILGVISLISGVIRLIKYAVARKSDTQSPVDIILGILSFAAAFILLIHPTFLPSILPFLVGLLIFFSGTTALFSKRRRGFAYKIIAIIILLFGISLMINPFKGAVAVNSLIGFALLIWGIVSVIAEFLSNDRPNIPPDKNDDDYKEVDFKDV